MRPLHLTVRMTLRLALLATLLVLAAPAVEAQATAVARSPECQAALQALAAAEDAAIAGQAAHAAHAAQTARSGALQAPPPAAVLQRRRIAARACLGVDDVVVRAPASMPGPGPGALAGRTGPAGEPATPIGPISPISLVPPVPPIPRVAPAAPPRVAPAPIRPPPLVTLTACDPLGCWTSDGQRLPQHGPHLLGPRGLCVPHGPFLACP